MLVKINDDIHKLKLNIVGIKIPYQTKPDKEIHENNNNPTSNVPNVIRHREEDGVEHEVKKKWRMENNVDEIVNIEKAVDS